MSDARTGAKVDPWGPLGQVLECSVCLETLDASSRVLPCQHTFCYSCLMDIVNSHGELRCPECRTLVTVPFELLPTNILLVRILESMKISSSTPTEGVSEALKVQPTAEIRKSSLNNPFVPSITFTSSPSIGHFGSTSTSADCTVTTTSVLTAASFDPLSQDFTPDISNTVSSALSGRSSSLTSIQSAQLPKLVTFTSVNNVGITEVERLGSAVSTTLATTFNNNFGNSVLAITDAASGRPFNQPSSSGLSGHDLFVSDMQNGVCSDNLSYVGTTVASDCTQPCAAEVASTAVGVRLNEHPTVSSESVGIPLKELKNILLLNSMNVQAKALFNYEKREESELTFKKGDMLNIIKKVDNNWFQGELRGQKGFFPISYVKILDPATNNSPQCKALFDFKVSREEEDKGCLTFTKGETLTVLRRVDANWIEGKLMGRIGIFPLSFVKLNDAAENLLRVPSTISIPTLSQTNKDGVLTSVSQKPNVPAPPLSTLVMAQPNSSLSQPTSARATSSTLTASEVLRISSGSGFVGQSCPVTLASSLSDLTARQSTNPFLRDVSDLKNNPNQDNPKLISEDGLKRLSMETIANLKIYVAVYNYRPKKADELELVKGRLYSVFEKCQDGWFKGRCISTDKMGVFPGNYVQLAKPENINGFISKCSTAQARNLLKCSPRNKSYSKELEEKIVYSHIIDGNSTSVSPIEEIGHRNPPDLPPRVSRASTLLTTHSESNLNVRSSPSSASNMKGGITCNFSQSQSVGSKSTHLAPLIKERYRCITPYPPNSPYELELKTGDIIYVHRKGDDGWYKGTLLRTGKCGLFPKSFVEQC